MSSGGGAGAGEGSSFNTAATGTSMKLPVNHAREAMERVRGNAGESNPTAVQAAMALGSTPQAYNESPLPTESIEGVRAMRLVGGFAPRPGSMPAGGNHRRLIFGGGYAIKRKTILNSHGEVVDVADATPAS